MADQRKLDSWAEKLLDTGKRNNLISFKDSKGSTAEIVFPECETVFSKCSVGHVFEVYDPAIKDADSDDEIEEEPTSSASPERRLSKDQFIERYVSRIKNQKTVLVYAQTPNPMTAVKSIAKKARSLQDETGINVAYLAFGFLRWNEKEDSQVFYKAPLLLVHVNVITGTILEPVKIEVTDDDVIVNPTFNYLLQAEYSLSLPEFEDSDTLSTYYSKIADITARMGWECHNECKLGIFSFQKINMYEDLRQNADLILSNNNIRALLKEDISDQADLSGIDYEHIVDNPLIDLHTVTDADSSQIEAIELAKSGKSFVLQGPPGTGKSQTITNIIAECLHDGKTVLFVSEKQAALNVVFNKLKNAGLEDFCLELHSHKANKKAVIEELCRTLELPKSMVSSSAQEEIRQKQDAQQKLDSYAAELHKNREPINKSLYQLFELYSAQRGFSDIQFDIKSIQTKGQDDLTRAVHLLEQYAEYVPSIGRDYRQNAWYGFTNDQISYEDRNALRNDLEHVLSGYRALRDSTEKIEQNTRLLNSILQIQEDGGRFSISLQNQTL